MTEAEWKLSTDLKRMIEFIAFRLTERKVRLFGYACCRRVSHLLADPRCRETADTIFRWVEGACPQPDIGSLFAAVESAQEEIDRRHPYPEWRRTPANSAVGAVYWLLKTQPDHSMYTAACWAAEALGWEAVELLRPGQDIRNERTIVEDCEHRHQCNLIRHIVGNPFHPYPAFSSPLAVLELARAMDAGQHCRLPLSDALEESGHTELAEHFRQADHPKGCWALDLILDKN